MYKGHLNTRILMCAVIAAMPVLFFSDNKKSEKNVDSFSSIQAIKTSTFKNSEEIVRKLISEVYNGVEFKKESGNGKDYLVRYYCSNVCIDACKNGVIKYISDITAKASDDLFSAWLFDDENARIIEEKESSGIIYQRAEGKNLTADMLINPENKRIFAAKIYIKYHDE